MRKIYLIAAGLLVTTGCLFFTGTHASAYSGGDGTPGDPLQITTCADLTAISTNATTLGESYVLMNNLDCSSAGNAAMIGSSSLPFTGRFDGGKHSITVAINNLASTKVGLFSATNGATIHDLTVAGSVAGSTYTGALVGFDNGDSTIQRIAVTANVTSNNYNVGGLVGFLGTGSSLSDAYFSAEVYTDGSVLSGDQVGSIVGLESGAGTTVSRVYATGIVHSSKGGSIGGLIGNVSSGSSLADSFFTGVVDMVGSNRGLLVGYSFQTGATNSYADQYLSDMGWSTAACYGANINGASCMFVNHNGTQPGYFLGNDTNGPFGNWDFDTVWQTNANGYPTLRGFATAPPAIATFASTDASSDIYIGGTNFVGSSLTFGGSAATIKAIHGTTQLTADNQTSPSLVILTNSDNQIAAVVYKYDPSSASLLATLSFDTQGGSSAAGATLVAGQGVVLPAAPTRSGYTFLNWNTAADGSGNSYGAGDSYTATGNVTFYAIWQAESSGGNTGGSNTSTTGSSGKTPRAPDTGLPRENALPRLIALTSGTGLLGVLVTAFYRKRRKSPY